MHPHRRRKKRPNYGARTVEVSRGHNGFGFTISGQQPCILSCIVSESPADSAGLRPGDFLISVNGLNVSKLPHDAVVQLIGNSVGLIRMTIAENYFSDSSDEDALAGRPVHGNRQRPKYPHANRSRMHKAGRISNYSPDAVKTANNVLVDQEASNSKYKPSSLGSVKESVPSAKSAAIPSSSAHCVIINPSISNKNDINNVSAMVNPGIEQVRSIKVIRDLRTGAMFEEISGAPIDLDKVTITQSLPNMENLINVSDVQKKPSAEVRMEPISKIIIKESSIECRAIVGYLGTIEMPKQIATSSKLQTVRSCIRKMRQEKRTPCTVLMTILPSCMTLRNSSGEILAEYPAKRLNYVSCSSENDYRFFGLVTSACYPIEINEFDGMRKENEMSREDAQKEYDIAISNSCHVFMIDTQMVEHQAHIKKADTFKINCTIDPVSGTCLEFPNNSEYIVNIIRIMYSLKPPNGFSAKCNIENISRLSNLDRKSCSPCGSNFVRKLNKPKHLHEAPVNVRAEIPEHPVLRNDNIRYANNHPQENLRDLNRQEPDGGQLNGNDFVANSPQPSNHSEITTTSSNSDSGIGFHNDCQNISDRILVVDFPNPVRNNFNANAPYVAPAFNSRQVKVLPLRENARPLGIIGLDIDMDGQFLSNTTPVVEGFSGQGRPLNHVDSILLGNIASQANLHSVFLPKETDEASSSVGGSETLSGSANALDDPSTSSGSYLYSCNQKLKNQPKNKLTVRAMPDHYEPCEKSQKDNLKIPDNLRSYSPRKNHSDNYDPKLTSKLNDSRHYDSVYSDNTARYEEHHYEIIFPDENNMCNENVANSEKSEKYDWKEPRPKIESHYSERPVDVPDCHNDYFTTDVDTYNNSSFAACSYDDMSVTSSRSHDCGRKKGDNFSNDDVSIYSSKSHDGVAANPQSKSKKSRKLQTSVDDISIFKFKNSESKTVLNAKKSQNEQSVFLHPNNIVKLRTKKSKRSSMFSSKNKQSSSSNSESHICAETRRKSGSKDSLLKYKLSPKVFGLSRPSASVEDVCKSSGGGQERWWHLEGTASEPDLRECHTADLYMSEGGSPFGRWTGGSGRALTHRSCRRPGSLASSEHDMYTKQIEGEPSSESAPAGAAAWARSLELLLGDPRGAHALAAFLEREFSAENIRFWTACERYSRAPPAARPALAARLHERHLAEGAPEPVNVDAPARQRARARLAQAPPDLFLQAQKQIFNLMKFDSYPRFIKSDIHKDCLLAELQGRSPPYPGDPELALGPSSPTPSPTKLKKSLSNAEDRRRKSLLPWHRKLRSKSRDRCCEEDEADEDAPRPHDPRGSNSSLLTHWELTRGLNNKPCGSSSCSCEGTVSCTVHGALCRVLVPGAAATSSVVAVSPEETIRQLMDRLLHKRAIRFLAYEVYLPGSNKPIDINQSSCALAGKEVTVEQRVVFKLDLPNRKVISVKSKPNKALGDVLRPILHKYGVGGAAGLCLTLASKMLELSMPVQIADGQRLQVTLRSTLIQQSETNGKNYTINDVNNSSSNPSQSAVNGTTPGAPSLDEITNRVFEELLQGKADRHAVNTEEQSVKSDNCSSEHSSGIFGRFLRRDDHRSKGLKVRRGVPSPLASCPAPPPCSEGGSSVTLDDPTATSRPLIAKLRAGVKIQNAVGIPGVMENTEFIENLKQIQRARLKDKIGNGVPAPTVNGQELQNGKENNSKGKTETHQFQFYDDRAQTAESQNSAPVAPVAATRVTPTLPNLNITKPCPAPRLSLGQGSPNKLINGNPFPKAESTALKNGPNSPEKDSFKNHMDYSPTKNGFSDLDSTVIENNLNLDVTLCANPTKTNHYNTENNNTTQNVTSNLNSKYGNLAQDYLNSSTTSGSDHFMRTCDILNSSFHSTSSSCENEPFRNSRINDPPPLPPKPKVLPIKPSNWGQALMNEDSLINMRMQEVSLPEISAKESIEGVKRTVYLDQPSSSFV